MTSRNDWTPLSKVTPGYSLAGRSWPYSCPFCGSRRTNAASALGAVGDLDGLLGGVARANENQRAEGLVVRRDGRVRHAGRCVRRHDQLNN
jgi:hypothetical protein